MNSLDTVAKITLFLQQYGGWALSVILMVAIVYLYRTMGGLLEKRNNELKALLVECKTVIAEDRMIGDQMKDAMVSSEGTIKDNSTVLLRVKVYLEDLRR
jgi:hypothetical protein